MTMQIPPRRYTVVAGSKVDGMLVPKCVPKMRGCNGFGAHGVDSRSEVGCVDGVLMHVFFRAGPTGILCSVRVGEKYIVVPLTEF